MFICCDIEGTCIDLQSNRVSEDNKKKFFFCSFFYKTLKVVIDVNGHYYRR